MGAKQSAEASVPDDVAFAPHGTVLTPDEIGTKVHVDAPSPVEQKRSSAGPAAAALEFIPFGDLLFGSKEDRAGTTVAKEYTHAAKEQMKQISVLQSNTETINAKAAQAYAETAMEQVLKMRSELESLRQELAESRKLALANAQKLALATTASTDVESLQPPVISQTFSSAPLVPTLEEIKARRKAELEAAEEFAFAGRALGLPSRLRTAGFSCTEAKQVAGYTFSDARAAGYSLAEAAEADYAEAREALASMSRRGSIQEYTPFELTNGPEQNDDESESGEGGELDVVPTPNELVKRWQNEVPALRARSLSKQQTQSLSMLAEMLTGDVDSKHSDEKELGETSPIDVQREWLTNQEEEIASTPEKNTAPHKCATLDMVLAESPS